MTDLIIQEVGPRDGLQNESALLTLPQKLELIRRLTAAGIRRLEAGSFVHPKAVPAMAESEEVFAQLLKEDPEPAVTYSALALNAKGFERALAAGAREIHFSFGVTSSFNRQNQRAEPEESFATFLSLLPQAREKGIRTTLTLSVSWGCPFEGWVDPGRVLSFVERAGRAGFPEIVLADTIGVAVPSQVRRLTEEARKAAPQAIIGGHFHNTRNTGIANAYAALEGGARVLDASIGGLGGCPFAPGATGNIATEDLVYMVEGMGISTGIHLEELIEVAKWLQDVLGHPLESSLLRAGPFRPRGAIA
ncbi:MAG: hydroxymethylglutaryl-CoA lyase [Bacillota bacterium]|nr:hydroxymethylglutaryl-CoA lyase [Bacillota bacterium]